MRHPSKSPLQDAAGAVRGVEYQMFGHGISHESNEGTRCACQLDSTYSIPKQSQILGALPWDMIVDHVVGVGSRAAGAVPAQRTVHVRREMVGEIGDLEAALQAGLAAHDAHFPDSSLLNGALHWRVEEDGQRVCAGGQRCRLLQGAGRYIVGRDGDIPWLPSRRPDRHLSAWLQAF